MTLQRFNEEAKKRNIIIDTETTKCLLAAKEPTKYTLEVGGRILGTAPENYNKTQISK